MKNKSEGSIPVEKLSRRRKLVEGSAAFGMILVAAGLVAPFASMENIFLMRMFKWIYAAGALIYIVSRVVNVNSPDDSLRLRRMRRMEAWAGLAFCIGAFFWFYNAHRLGETIFTLGLLQQTIMFTLAGALIQIIASWMISARTRKEMKQREESGKDKSGDKK